MTVMPDVAKSGHVPGEVVMSVALRNDSTKMLRFAVDRPSESPPYLNWLYYKILKSGPAGLVEDIGRVPFDDGVVSFDTLSIGPGDASTLLFFFENTSKEDCSNRFVVELEDKSDNVFRSQPFSPCNASGAGRENRN